MSKWAPGIVSFLAGLALFLGGGHRAAEPPKHLADLKKDIAADYPHLEALYQHLHANPELSLHEIATAARIAKELKAAGFEVAEKVGGTGLVGVLKNGKGPTVLVRADMDGLPITEATGVSYASKVRTRDKDGNEVGVMHACGHDINMTCLVGTARRLAAMKDRWQGTLILVGQPAEEVGAGARLMLADKLYERFGEPDYCLALHCASHGQAGIVYYREGYTHANVDTVDIVVKGKGGHGAARHMTVDPIVLACKIVLDLQTLISREKDPTDPAVVTVGSIHGGTKHNIIPNEVKLQLTVRTVKDATRKQVLDGIRRMAKAAAEAMRAPEPTVEIDPVRFTPAPLNDTALTRKVVGHWKEALGADRVKERPLGLGGEDFSRFLRDGVPGFYFFIGVHSPERVAEAQREGGRPLAAVHSDQFAPVPEPTIATGVLGMTTAVLHLMPK